MVSASATPLWIACNVALIQSAVAALSLCRRTPNVMECWRAAAVVETLSLPAMSGRPVKVSSPENSQLQATLLEKVMPTRRRPLLWKEE